MYALERREIQFRGSKTEYMCVNVKETGEDEDARSRGSGDR